MDDVAGFGGIWPVVLSMLGAALIFRLEMRSENHHRPPIPCDGLLEWRGRGKKRGFARQQYVDGLRFVLQWNVDGKIVKHCILPDMADRDAYRRLKYGRAGVGKKKTKQNLRQIWIKRLFQTAF